LLEWTDFICVKDKRLPKKKLGRTFNKVKAQEEIMERFLEKVLACFVIKTM